VGISAAWDLAAQSPRGAVATAELMERFAKAEVEAVWREAGVPGRPEYGVALYRIVYHTVDAHGSATEASGVLAVPEGHGRRVPLLSYHHGTTVARDRVASARGFDFIGMSLAATGYAAALPDYLGLGVSEGLHPYVHAASLSTTIVDFLRAVRQFCAGASILLDDRLFLMGYSEGGYATMAAHRAIESEYADEFDVTASAPMAGPYSLSEAMFERMIDDRPYPTTVYLPFTLLAYDTVYDWFADPRDVFVAPYDTLLAGLFDGRIDWREIGAQLPDVPRRMLQPAFVEALIRDRDHPLRRLLVDNDLTEWSPRAPMNLFHCLDDEQVPHRNAELAVEAFRRLGATHVELTSLTFGGHEDCAPAALYLGKRWFDSFAAEDGVWQADRLERDASPR
jgi:poly(3-hydroxybutyrate) depolymerase